MNFDVKYIVKPEDNTVICIIENCKFNAIETIILRTETCPHDVPEEFFLNNQYKGISKCASGDIFNEEYGKKLAYRKAYLKYITAFGKKVNIITNNYKKYTESILDNFNKVATKVNKKIDIATEKYNETLKEML